MTFPRRRQKDSGPSRATVEVARTRADVEALLREIYPLLEQLNEVESEGDND